MKLQTLKKLANIANDLDQKGFSKEASAITDVMMKIAADEKTTSAPTETKIPPRTDPKLQDVKTFITKDRPGYDESYEKDFQRILENYSRMPERNQLYYFLKGLASEYYKEIDPAKFANNFLRWYNSSKSRSFTPRQDNDSVIE